MLAHGRCEIRILHQKFLAVFNSFISIASLRTARAEKFERIITKSAKLPEQEKSKAYLYQYSQLLHMAIAIY